MCDHDATPEDPRQRTGVRAPRGNTGPSLNFT